MNALDRFLEERNAEDELLELLARGFREAAEARPRPILHVVGNGEWDAVDSLIVPRHDWSHGLVPCPSCGLPLDPEKDRDAKILYGVTGIWSGVRGTHRRCGAKFFLEFKGRERRR